MKALFKFSPSGNGAAGFFQFGPHKKSKEIVMFARIVRQVSWDASKKVGSCRGGEEVKTMLSQFEQAGILDAINNRTSYKTYHKGSTGQSAITFDHINEKGFTYKVFKNDKNFLINLSYPEARLLALSIEANLKLDATRWFYETAGSESSSSIESSEHYDEDM